MRWPLPWQQRNQTRSCLPHITHSPFFVTHTGCCRAFSALASGFDLLRLYFLILTVRTRMIWTSRIPLLRSRFILLFLSFSFLVFLSFFLLVSRMLLLFAPWLPSTRRHIGVFLLPTVILTVRQNSPSLLCQLLLVLAHSHPCPPLLRLPLPPFLNSLPHPLPLPPSVSSTCPHPPLARPPQARAQLPSSAFWSTR